MDKAGQKEALIRALKELNERLGREEFLTEVIKGLEANTNEPILDELAEGLGELNYLVSEAVRAAKAYSEVPDFAD